MLFCRRHIQGLRCSQAALNQENKLELGKAIPWPMLTLSLALSLLSPPLTNLGEEVTGNWGNWRASSLSPLTKSQDSVTAQELASEGNKQDQPFPLVS